VADLTIYNGEGEAPAWNPDASQIKAYGFPAKVEQNAAFLIDNAIANRACWSLITELESQLMYPVGISGYSNEVGSVGSHRANAWAVDLAAALKPAFDALPNHFFGDGRDFTLGKLRIPSPFETRPRYTKLGSTPWMRFMKYRQGGMHVPHYDAPFHNEEQSYVTLFSWIIYLNTVPPEAGGQFQFVDDGQSAHPQDRAAGAFADWHEMATDAQVLNSIQPVEGRMLVFPHWLCHQVQPYTGNKTRYIVRGDLAYGYDE